jgi:hypothetical protein
MLTNEAITILIEFGDKTKASIVTSKMTEADLDRLEMMLLDWKAQPTAEKEQAIISKFAIVREPDSDEPGPDY